MRHIFVTLFPQMHRWRSLEVISDTLKPLCAALQALSTRTLTPSDSGGPCSDFLLGSRAPRLEFIKLKRSNDYYRAHLKDFARPMELDSIPFAALIGRPNQDVREQDQNGLFDQDIPAHIPASSCPLPKLRHVHLFGVPMNWTGFLHVLGVDHQIQSLELSHHDEPDRPTFDQFSAIIKACPLLRKLVIMASGPILTRPFHNCAIMSLPMLEELRLGYIETDSLDVLFSRLDAPNLVALSIEDMNPTVP